MKKLSHHGRSKFSATECIIMLLIISSLLFTLSTGNHHYKQTAYEVIQDYNFPIGILPKGVTGFDLDESTGEFTAYLNQSCSFSLENSSYRLSYQPTIHCYISQGKLSKLEGVKVKMFIFWADIVEVLRNGDELEFSIGIASTKFSIDSFQECPQCGCGFICANPFTPWKGE